MAGQDLRPGFADAAVAFGVPATVTRPDDDPIDTTVVWVPPLMDAMPPSEELHRREAKRILGISKADVPTVPTRTVIEAPEELGGEVKRWRVDGTDLIGIDETRVVVVLIPE